MQDFVIKYSIFSNCISFAANFKLEPQKTEKNEITFQTTQILQNVYFITIPYITFLIISYDILYFITKRYVTFI